MSSVKEDKSRQIEDYLVKTFNKTASLMAKSCRYVRPGNTKGGSITVLLTSCLTGLESAVRLLTFFVLICKTD